MNRSKRRCKGKRYYKRYLEGKNTAGFGYNKVSLSEPPASTGRNY